MFRRFYTFISSISLPGMPYYAVKVGKKPGVYESWGECEAQVKGFNGAKFKKFPTEREAKEFAGVASSSVKSPYRQPQASTAKSLKRPYEPATTPPSIADLQRLGDSYVHPGAKRKLEKSKKSDIPSRKLAAQLTGLKHSLELFKQQNAALHETCYHIDNQIDSIISTGEPTSPLVQKRTLHTDIPRKRQKTESQPVVYTDGACINNGRENARAGIGVYWGPGHQSNVSERLPGRQTNNRAEIYAICRAIQQAKDMGHEEITIKTDSQFTINCITKWVHNWKKNGWKLSTGKPVINREELEILDKLQENMTINWEHVSAHIGIEGNEMADKLANEGAMKE